MAMLKKQEERQEKLMVDLLELTELKKEEMKLRVKMCALEIEIKQLRMDTSNSRWSSTHSEAPDDQKENGFLDLTGAACD